MLDSYARPLYKKMIEDPTLPFLKKVSPNFLTGIALITGLISAFFISLQKPFWALTFLIFSGLLDTLDGALARLRGKASPLGAVYDISSDRFVEFSVILGLYLYDPTERGLGSLLMLGGAFLCVTTFLVVGIFTEMRKEKSFHYSPGLMERGEAFIFFFALILYPTYFVPLSYTFAILTFWTAGYRLWEFRHSSLDLIEGSQ